MEILDKIYAVDAKFRDVGVIFRETKMRTMEAQMEKTSLQKTPAPARKSIGFGLSKKSREAGWGLCAVRWIRCSMKWSR